MTNGKNQVRYSLDEKLIATISNIGAKKGVPVSDIVETYLNRGVSKEIEITSAERYNFERIAINGTLDSLLRLFGILQFEGGLSDKCCTIMVLCTSKDVQKKSEIRYGLIEISFFEVLNDLKSFDKDLWEKIMVNLGRNRRMRDRYFNLYPK